MNTFVFTISIMALAGAGTLAFTSGESSPKEVRDETQSRVVAVDHDEYAKEQLQLARKATTLGNTEDANHHFAICSQRALAEDLYLICIDEWTQCILLQGQSKDNVLAAKALNTHLIRLDELKQFDAANNNFTAEMYRNLSNNIKFTRKLCLENHDGLMEDARSIYAQAKGELSWWPGDWNDNEPAIASAMHHVDLGSMYYGQLDSNRRTKMFRLYQKLWDDLSSTEFAIQRNMDAFLMGPEVERRLDRIMGGAK